VARVAPGSLWFADPEPAADPAHPYVGQLCVLDRSREILLHYQTIKVITDSYSRMTAVSNFY